MDLAFGMARSRHLQAKYAANHRKQKNAAQQQQQSIEGERSDDGEPSRRRQRLDSDPAEAVLSVEAAAFADAGGGAEGGGSGQVVGGNVADSGQVDGLATAQRTIQDGPSVGCDVGMFSYCVFVNSL